MPSFPAEITDLFIDNCYEGLDSSCATLISCSLVCKQWVSATRRQLFSDVTVSMGRGILQFGDLFHSPNATITPFVKSMSIVAADANRQTGTQEKSLVQLLSKLAVVPFHSFSLEFADGEGSTKERSPEPLSTFARDIIGSYHQVVDLTLHCDFGTLSELVDLVCSLPSLTFVDLSPRIEDSSICPERCPPATLQKVKIERGLLPVLDWISNITPDHSISDIFLVYALTADNTTKISQFLKSQGNKLTELALKSKDVPKRRNPFGKAHIDISGNTGLHTLELHSLHPEHLKGTLDSVSATLSELNIDLGPHFRGDEVVGSERVNEMLFGPHFLQLKNLTIGRKKIALPVSEAVPSFVGNLHLLDTPPRRAYRLLL